MIGPLTICLGLGLSTLTDSHMHPDNNSHCSLESKDPTLTLIESPSGYRPQHKQSLLNMDRQLFFSLPYFRFCTLFLQFTVSTYPACSGKRVNSTIQQTCSIVKEGWTAQLRMLYLYYIFYNVLLKSCK